MQTPALYALVPCAGQGERAGSSVPKQYVEVAGRSVIAHTLAALGAVKRLHATLVVVAPGEALARVAIPTHTERPCWVAGVGGATRAASVANGLQELRRRGASDDDWVLVHDAARCLLSPQSVDALIDACINDAVGGLLAIPLTDTLKQGLDDRVTETLPRDGKWLAQTPQMFRLGLLERALGAADNATDEASAIEALGLRPLLVRGSRANLKLTWPEDFELAQRWLSRT